MSGDNFQSEFFSHSEAALNLQWDLPFPSFVISKEKKRDMNNL